MYKNALDVRKRVNEHYCETKKMGYDVVGVFLIGSQNYNLQYENSEEYWYENAIKCTSLEQYLNFISNI